MGVFNSTDRGPTEGVVVVGHHVCESERNVTTSDDLLCFSGLVSQLWSLLGAHIITLSSKKPHQQEREDDTPEENPLSDVEGDEYTTVDSCTLFENFV